MRRAWSGTLAITTLGLLAAPADAVRIEVDTTADQFETGARCSLREAVRAAQDDAAFGGCPGGSGGDKVDLRAGEVYELTGPPGGAIGMPGELAIRATGGGRATVDASAAGEGAFVVDGQSNALRDLVIRGGESAIGGGGVHLTELSSLRIFDSVIRGNSTDTDGGGGVYSLGDLDVTRSTVTGNEASGAEIGGGIAQEGGSLDLIRSTVSGNEALGAAGVALESADVLIENSTISGNEALANAGGLYLGAGTAALNNTTVSRNVAGADGGGVYANPTAAFSARNSIVAGNDAAAVEDGPDCNGTLGMAYSLLGEDAGCTVIPTGENVIGEPARLLGLAANGGPTQTMALRASSPARNSANPADPGSGSLACAVTDQRGVNRPRGPRCDMGAYEG